MNVRSPFPDLHRLRRLAMLAAACLAVPAPAAADWRASLDGGTEIRSGSSTQRLRGTLTEPTRPLTRALGIEVLRDSAAGNTVLLDARANYWLTRSGYGFVDTRALYDEPLGIDRQVRAIAGPGFRWQSTPAGAIGIEAGGGVVYTRRDGVFEEEEGAEGIGMVRADGFRAVLDRVRLGARLEAARTSSLTELRGEVSVGLALGIGSVRYTVQTRRLSPDEGPDREQTHGFVSFGYRF